MKICVDYGHHSIKALDEKGNKVPFPSLVSTDVKDLEMFNLKGEYNILENLRVEFEGKEYFVGDQARDQSDFVLQQNFDDDFDTQETRTLINTAIALLIDNSEGEIEEVELLVTLPVSSYFQNKDKFKSNFNNQDIKIKLYNYNKQEYEQIKFKINNCQVKQQGFTALMDYILTKEGKLSEGQTDFASNLVTVIDIGYFSTDDYSMKELEPVASGKTKISGMVQAYDKLSDDIQAEFGINKKPYELEDSIRNQKLKLDGKTFNISNFLNKEFDNLANYIHNELRSQFSKFREVDQFLLTGGGSLHLHNYLEDKIDNMVHQNNPVFSNARGGLKWMKRNN